MENFIKIINNRLDEQSLIGKESLTIDEIKNILDQVNNLVSKKVSIETKKDFCTKEQRDTFNEIVSKFTCTKKSDEFPNRVFYMVGDLVYIEQDLKSDDFYIRYSGFWEVFQTKFDLNFQEIKELLCGLLGEHLNCEVNSTYESYRVGSIGLEERLKCKVNTASTQV